MRRVRPFQGSRMDAELEAIIAFLPPEFADPGVAFADPPTLRANLKAIADQAAAAGMAFVQNLESHNPLH